MMSGMIDAMIVWKDDGTRNSFIKHYKNMFAGDTFSINVEEYEHTEFVIGRSTLFSLKPKNVLLLKVSPTGQWK